MWFIDLTIPGKGIDRLYFETRAHARYAARWYRHFNDTRIPITHISTPRKAE